MWKHWVEAELVISLCYLTQADIFQSNSGFSVNFFLFYYFFYYPPFSVVQQGQSVNENINTNCNDKKIFSWKMQIAEVW